MFVIGFFIFIFRKVRGNVRGLFCFVLFFFFFLLDRDADQLTSKR